MGILGKLMFWKKKDEFADVGLGDKGNLAFGNDFGAQTGANTSGLPGTNTSGMPGGLGPEPGMDQGLGQQPPAQDMAQPSVSSFSQPQQPQFSPPQPNYPSPQQEVESKNLEIISSKLDALRASIESLNQRLANLEALARGEEEDSRRKRYY